MKKKFLNIALSLLSVALIAVIALTGCGGNGENGAAEAPQGYAVTEIGQGATVFRFEVTCGEESFTVWNVQTDEETVGAALLAVGLVDGEDGQFGLFVTSVNGIEADFDADGTWWAFYIDGEMAMTGVGATYVEDGATYAFIFTR